MVRAKFQVNSITKHSWNKDAVTVRLSAVCADSIPENQRYHKYTPSGSMEITIDNPPAAEFFELGKYVYLDFSDATQAQQ